LKIAVVHEWLVNYAGSERVLEQIIQLYPSAELYSLIDFLPAGERAFILDKAVHTSFIQNIPFAKKKYRSYLPLMPLAVEQFDLSGYDVIISSCHAVAKGILTKSGQLHICYCHTPIRYAWDLYHQYLKESGLNAGLRGLFVKLVLHYIRMWDYMAANRVDYFVANSHFTAERIRRIYGKDSAVIYPPVDIDAFAVPTEKEDFYFTASRMVPYKKIDLVVEAFAQMPQKRLVVAGAGPDFKKIKSKAAQNIEFLGYQSGNILREHMQRAKAFVFAAEEDFGILPVEAQACGTPVIAYGRGGARETVIENETGIFFEEQRAESLIRAVNNFEKNKDVFSMAKIRSNAEKFSKERFKAEFKMFVDEKIIGHRSLRK
jgi:glycosyltransferase involved in cell wall biosynthesis